MKNNDEIIKKWENTSKYYDGFGGYITPNEILKMLYEARSDERAKINAERKEKMEQHYTRGYEHGKRRGLADFCKELEKVSKYGVIDVDKFIREYFSLPKGISKSEFKIFTGRHTSVIINSEDYLALKQKQGIE